MLVELDGIGGGGKVQLEVSLCCQNFLSLRVLLICVADKFILYYYSVDGENKLNFQNTIYIQKRKRYYAPCETVGYD